MCIRDRPGESQVVSVEVDLQYIASYDNTYDNGDGTVGTYILDPGTYYFAMGNGAHDALNHMMARQGADPESLSGESNSAMAYEHKITEDFISSTAFSCLLYTSRWGIGSGEVRIPAEKELTDFINRTGYHHIRLLPDKRAAIIDIEGITIDPVSYTHLKSRL